MAMQKKTRKGGHREKNEFPKENKGFVIKENVAAAPATETTHMHTKNVM